VPEAKRKPGEGAGHASDQPFTFGALRVALEKVAPADEATSKLMGDYIVAFARTGDPNGAGRPTWPKYERKADRMLVFSNEGPVVRPAPRAAALDALEAAKSR
jgi:para-nitrobenzyl esterase